MTRWFYVALTLVLLGFAASGYTYFGRFDQLPDQVPTHWNLHGEPDAWVPKENILGTLLWLPLAMSGLLLLMLVLPRISPRHFEVTRFAATFDMLMTVTIGLLLYLHLLVMFVPELIAGDGRFVIGGIVAVLALIGLFLPKVQRNFWMGIRTPWTLASDLVWQATHRVAAWCFVGGGALCLLLLLGGAPVALCFTIVLVMVCVPILFSLVYYKFLESHGLLDLP